MKTEFVPKLVATVTVCCASYVVLAASDKIVTVRTLASIGYFDALVYTTVSLSMRRYVAPPQNIEVENSSTWEITYSPNI